MIVIEFFRDTLSGIYYYIYVALNIFFILAIIGYIGEKKQKELESTEENVVNKQLNSSN